MSALHGRDTQEDDDYRVQVVYGDEAEELTDQNASQEDWEPRASACVCLPRDLLSIEADKLHLNYTGRTTTVGLCDKHGQTATQCRICPRRWLAPGQ